MGPYITERLPERPTPSSQRPTRHLCATIDRAIYWEPGACAPPGWRRREAARRRRPLGRLEARYGRRVPASLALPPARPGRLAARVFQRALRGDRVHPARGPHCAGPGERPPGRVGRPDTRPRAPGGGQPFRWGRVSPWRPPARWLGGASVDAQRGHGGAPKEGGGRGRGATKRALIWPAGPLSRAQWAAEEEVGAPREALHGPCCELCRLQPLAPRGTAFLGPMVLASWSQHEQGLQLLVKDPAFLPRLNNEPLFVVS